MATQKKIAIVTASKELGSYRDAATSLIALLGNTIFIRAQLLGFILFWITITISFTQSNPNRLDPDDYHFEVVDLPDIGTNINIECIAQDSTGYLWLATDRGLVRYDGYRTKPFLHNPLDSTSISSNNVSSLFLDQEQQVLWAATYDNGINRIDLSSEVFTRFLPGYQIWIITGDAKGHVWVGTTSDGLYRLDTETDSTRHFPHIPGDSTSLSAPEVKSLYIDSEDELLVGMGPLNRDSPGGGLNRYVPESESFIHYRHQPDNHNNLPSPHVWAILEDTRKQFWIGTPKGLVRWVDSLSGMFMTNPLGSPVETSGSPWVISLFQDLDQRMWIGTMGGLYYTDPRTNRQIRFETETIDPRYNIIWRMSQSRDSVYWVGTGKSGSRLFKFFRKPTPVRYHQPTARIFVEDKEQDKVWIGTDSAIVLYHLERGVLKNYPYHSIRGLTETISGHPQDHPRVMQRDSRGKIWLAGSDQQGSPMLCSFDPATEEPSFYSLHPEDSTSPSGYHITDILEDHNERLWVTTIGGGVYSFDPLNKSFVRFTLELGDSSALEYVLDLYEDRQENLWMVSQIPEHKLSLIRSDPDKGTFEQINIPAGSSFGGITEDASGYLWIAIDRSLVRLDPKTYNFQTFNSENSTLPNAELSSLVVDDQGQIWFQAYVFDLYRFSPDVGSISYHWKVERANGEPLGLSPGRNFKMRDGVILFGSFSSPFISVHPDQLKVSSPEELQIVEVRILGGKPSKLEERPDSRLGYLGQDGNLSLSHDQNSFALEFFIADYRDPSSRTFEFMLENYDDNWRKTGSIPEAVYHRVPAGKYEFRVRTTGVAGSIVPEKSIQIQILSAWWRRWWAQVLLGLFGLSLLGGAYHWRISQMKRRQKELEHLISVRTSEVRAQQERSDQLLLNILPKDVAEELKATGKTQPVHFEEVSILFSDFKEFTNIVASIPGKKLVSELDDIFQHFDDIMDEVGVEKIQTIGDAYVVAAGLPKTDPAHAIKCVKAGKRMIEYLNVRNKSNAIKWKVRVGIHSGPITAGVVGKKKFTYDLFGDTINIAARIESTSEVGRINLSAYTYDLVKDHFSCEYRGKINAKGKGDLDMYFVS